MLNIHNHAFRRARGMGLTRCTDRSRGKQAARQSRGCSGARLAVSREPCERPCGRRAPASRPARRSTLAQPLTLTQGAPVTRRRANRRARPLTTAGRGPLGGTWSRIGAGAAARPLPALGCRRALLRAVWPPAASRRCAATAPLFARSNTRASGPRSIPADPVSAGALAAAARLARVLDIAVWVRVAGFDGQRRRN